MTSGEARSGSGGVILRVRDKVAVEDSSGTKEGRVRGTCGRGVLQCEGKEIEGVEDHEPAVSGLRREEWFRAVPLSPSV